MAVHEALGHQPSVRRPEHMSSPHPLSFKDTSQSVEELGRGGHRRVARRYDPVVPLEGRDAGEERLADHRPAWQQKERFLALAACQVVPTHSRNGDAFGRMRGPELPQLLPARCPKIAANPLHSQEALDAESAPRPSVTLVEQRGRLRCAYHLWFDGLVDLTLRLDRRPSRGDHILEPVHLLPVGKRNYEDVPGNRDRNHRSRVLPSGAASPVPDHGGVPVPPPGKVHHGGVQYALVEEADLVSHPRPSVAQDQREQDECHHQRYERQHRQRDDAPGPSPRGLAVLLGLHGTPPCSRVHRTTEDTIGKYMVNEGRSVRDTGSVTKSQLLCTIAANLARL